MMAIHAITDMGIRAAVTAVDRNMAVITALTRAATVDTRVVAAVAVIVAEATSAIDFEYITYAIPGRS